MTPDPIPNEKPPEARSTAGMTTKVVKGSIWTLAGQVLPLGVSLLTTPIVIRLLGSEGYGVLILVALIPTYFSFADFGMGIASTKFASEAYGERDAGKEARVVRTAAVIAFLASLPIAAGIAVLSGWIVKLFNVPERLQGDAELALKFAAVTFVINFLSGIFNTPQLARLRMDLNTLVNTVFKVPAIIVAPFVIYLGYGIVGATFVLMLGSILTLGGHIYISGRQLPNLKGLSIDRESFRPLLKFGGALVFSGIAAVLLVNLEKLVLVKTTSVETLAYYSLAFTLAMMATMFAQAMIQSLIPAFSQLLAPQKLEQLQGLFSRSMRLILIALVPTLAILFVVAKPIFIYMGGEDFGRESTGPFRLLLFGLLFNILAFTPYSLLMASGRADIFAKLYWIELMPYVGLIAFLTIQFGALGAAAAWSIRVIADALVIGRIAIRSTDVSFAMFEGRGWGFVFAVLLFIPPLAISALLEEHFIWPFIIMPISLLIYTIVMWENFIDITERAWIISRLHSVTGK